MATESAYNEIRYIEEFYTAKVNSMVEADQEHQIADLTAHFDEDLRDAQRRAA